MANSQLIYSVREIFSEYLNGKYKYFNIPEYQRGYKWDTQQIVQLLDDIDKFNSNGNDDRFYCLQNITIVEKEGGYYNVVDGQQRLTTLLVLLSYFGKSETVKGKLEYSVRDVTRSFITEYILSDNIKNCPDWDSIQEIKYGDNDNYDHQDIFYLFSAYQTIKEYFKEKPENKESFEKKLLANVKLIVNKPYTDSEQNLFMNLNTGQVSLDGADLVRALLITNVAKEELDNSDLDMTKNIVRINEKRVRIGLEIDEISAWWNQPNVREYFKFLDKIKVSNSDTIDFNSEIYPVNLLYKLYLVKNGKPEIRLSYFENREYLKLYKELISLHRTIKDWYQDYEIYHFVKFLTTHTNNAFRTFEKIWKLWDNLKTRKSFIIDLKKMVSSTIEKENIEAIDNLEIDWFDNEDLFKILILLDIIQIVDSQNNNNKLPKLEAQYFKPLSEDREHIFPQTPISQKDIDKPTVELQKKVVKYLDILKTVGVEIDTAQCNWNSSDDLQKLKESINNELEDKIFINSIGNICLLHATPNRSYGNELYTRKRYTIIQQTKDGEHIRPHTLNAFDKGFSKNPDDNLDKWDNNDIEENAKYIKKQITKFLNQD